MPGLRMFLRPASIHWSWVMGTSLSAAGWHMLGLSPSRVQDVSEHSHCMALGIHAGHAHKREGMLGATAQTAQPQPVERRARDGYQQGVPVVDSPRGNSATCIWQATEIQPEAASWRLGCLCSVVDKRTPMVWSMAGKIRQGMWPMVDLAYGRECGRWMTYGSLWHGWPMAAYGRECGPWST